MSLAILTEVPKLNEKLDFASVGSRLTPLQMDMLRYINGLARAEDIFRVLDATTEEAINALIGLSDLGVVVISQRAIDSIKNPEAAKPRRQKSMHKDVPAAHGAFDSIPDDLPDTELPPAPKPADDLLDEIPDEFISEPESPRKSQDTERAAAKFDELPSDMPFEGEDTEGFSTPDLDGYDELPGEWEIPEPQAEPRLTPRVEVGQPAPKPGVRKKKIPGILSDELARMLIQMNIKRESASFKVTYDKGKSLVLDVYDGHVVRIIPRPLEPKMFLGMLLVKLFKMDPSYIEKSLAKRATENMWQGAALLKLGAVPPKMIYDTLAKQAETRFIRIFRKEVVGIKRFPPRVTKAPHLQYKWRPAMFSAIWNAPTDEELAAWIEENKDTVMKRILVDALLVYGVGDEMADLWRQIVINGNALQSTTKIRGLPQALAMRSMMAFWRIGLVELYKPDGSLLVKEGGGDFIADVDSDAPARVAKPAPIEPEPVAITFEDSAPEPVQAPPPLPVSEPTPEPPDFDFLDDEPTLEEPSEAPPSFDLPDPDNLASIDEDDDILPEKETTEQEAPKKKKRGPDRNKSQPDDNDQLRHKKKKMLEKKKKEAAAKHFEKGIEFFKRGEWPRATKRFARAEELQPENAEYLAYRTYSEFARFKDPADLKKTINDLKTAMELAPDSPEPWFLIGLAHKVTGDRNKANIYFKKVLEMNEHHTDALREVRLYNMAKNKEKPETTSFWTLSIGGKKK